MKEKIKKGKIESSSSIALQVKTLKELEQKASIVGRMKEKIKHLLFPMPDTLKESLEEILEKYEAEGETIYPEEKVMLHKVLAFGDLKVGDVMTPRIDIIAIDQETTLDMLKRIIIEKKHTRIPVYKNSLDDIIGFIHIKDLVSSFADNTPFKLGDIMRKILFVPTSMQIIDLLARMRASRVHMAIVVDEHGGTTGLVTMEDLMEEIVGEIRDEHDEAEAEYTLQKIDNTNFEVNPRMPIDILEEKLKMKISSPVEREDYDTVGGLIFFSAGRVPAKGEVITHHSGLEFEISESDSRRIKKILIRKQSKS